MVPIYAGRSPLYMACEASTERLAAARIEREQRSLNRIDLSFFSTRAHVRRSESRFPSHEAAAYHRVRVFGGLSQHGA